MSSMISVSWAASGKWAVRDSGDAVVVLGLGGGRLVGLIVDVQGAGDGASKTAWSLATLGSQLAGEGADVRSLAAVLNRSLWSRRGGRVQASLGIVLWEPGVGATIATYGSIVVAPSAITELDTAGSPPAAGLDRDVDPIVLRDHVATGSLVMCSDGVAAGLQELKGLREIESRRPVSASTVLEQAVARDQGRPRDDMSVIVLSGSGVDEATSSISGVLHVMGPRRTASSESCDD